MLFNTWFGQMRPKANSPGEFYYRPKRPIGRIQLRKLTPEGESIEYRADSFGNMNVNAPEHISDFVGLGYPLYNGMFFGPTTMEDVLWPNNPEYNRRIMEGLNLRKEV